MFRLRFLPGEFATAERLARTVVPDGDIHVRDTLAVAVSGVPIDADAIGRTRGRLAIIGLGPGDAALMPPAAREELRRAEDIFGYEAYVRMAAPFRPEQKIHASDNREEMRRARDALAQAATGRAVAVVSSGDPGVFAMAAAVMEALHEFDDPAWHSVEIAVSAGVSAALAAAARAGAPLGHDFCVLSLSDNLKPWAIIAQRLDLAAAADLVVALYNPASQARPRQFAEALDILRRHRRPETPVVLGRDIGRPGEHVTATTLGAVRPDQADMRTVVIVGSSNTRSFARTDGGAWVYTPRWYGDDAAQSAPLIGRLRQIGLQPRGRRRGRRHGGNVRPLRPLQHHDAQAELARRDELRFGRGAAAVLADDRVDAVPAQQRQLVLEPKRPARQHDLGCGEGVRRIGRLDRADQEPQAVEAGECRQLLPADGEEHASGRTAQRRDGLVPVRDRFPAVARDRLPCGARQPEQPRAHARAGFRRVPAHAHGKRMGRIDDRADVVVPQECGKAVDAAEPADPQLAGHRPRSRHAAGQRADDAQAGKADRGVCDGKSFARAAEDQQRHGFSGAVARRHPGQVRLNLPSIARALNGKDKTIMERPRSGRAGGP